VINKNFQKFLGSFFSQKNTDKETFLFAGFSLREFDE